MRKKTRQKIKINAAGLAGSLPWDADTCEKLEPLLVTTMCFGYYLGMGYDETKAAQKAVKTLEVMADE